MKSITDKGLLTARIEQDAMLAEGIQQKGQAVNLPGLYVATHCNGGSHTIYSRIIT